MRRKEGLARSKQRTDVLLAVRFDSGIEIG